MLGELRATTRRVAGGLRGFAATDARHDRRPRPAGRGRRSGAGHGCVLLGAARRRRPGTWNHALVGDDDEGHPGRPARDPAGGVGRSAAVLHRLEGAQRAAPRTRGQAGPEALGVRRCSEWRTTNASRPRPRRTIYAQLGLPWIPPTLREDRGEIEAARTGTLPHVVELADLRGDLHTHTDLTDGLASLAQMVSCCERRTATSTTR